jgi:hypothetical protein
LAAGFVEVEAVAAVTFVEEEDEFLAAHFLIAEPRGALRHRHVTITTVVCSLMGASQQPS